MQKQTQLSQKAANAAADAAAAKFTHISFQQMHLGVNGWGGGEVGEGGVRGSIACEMMDRVDLM